MSCAVIGASAAVTEEQKKEITDELFEDIWYRGMYADYWQLTRANVPIRDNPRVSTAYMTIEAEVAISDNLLLEKLYNGEIDIEMFYDENDLDYTKAKKLPKYNNSLLEGYEFSYVDYQNGVWEMKLEDTHETFYAYFREDENNFTLYDNDTNEVLGVYPRLLDFDYLDDDNNAAGGGNGGTGGNSNNNSTGTSSENTASQSDTASNSSVQSEIVRGTPNTSNPNSSDTGTASNEHQATYSDTDNPAVTPEIVSIVDAMKSSEPEHDRPISQSPPKSSNNNSLIIIIAVVILIGGAAFLLINKNKHGSEK